VRPMTEHLPAFGRHLQARGYAPRTAQAYAAAARRFHRERGNALDAAAVRSWRDELRARGTEATVRGALAGLSAWCCYLQRAGIARDLPAVPTARDPEEDRRRRDYRGPDAPVRRGRPRKTG
jgi:hypothetical protein